MAEPEPTPAKAGVWATDITHIPMARGFIHLVAIADWFTRRVPAWRVWISFDAAFCIEALEEAPARHGRLAILNSDQGFQFTSAAFTAVLHRKQIAIGMDGKGRWRDNVFVERLCRSVKYEEIYLNAYVSVPEARAGIGCPFRPTQQTNLSTCKDGSYPIAKPISEMTIPDVIGAVTGRGQPSGHFPAADRHGNMTRPSTHLGWPAQDRWAVRRGSA